MNMNLSITDEAMRDCMHFRKRNEIVTHYSEKAVISFVFQLKVVRVLLV